jgi:hypothetical protein
VFSFGFKGNVPDGMKLRWPSHLFVLKLTYGRPVNCIELARTRLEYNVGLKLALAKHVHRWSSFRSKVHCPNCG